MITKYPLKRTTHILILDNEEKGLEVTRKYFSLAGISISTTKNNDQAFIELQKNYTDCIIINTTIPNNETLNFTQKLKANQKFKYIPFILLTSKGLTRDRIEGYKIGCSAYLSKPFDLLELEHIIRNIINQKNSILDLIHLNYCLLKKIRQNIAKNYKNSVKSTIDLKLTSKEELILSYLLKSKSTKLISTKLKIGTRNIERSISKLINKIQIKNAKELKLLPLNLI